MGKGTLPGPGLNPDAAPESGSSQDLKQPGGFSLAGPVGFNPEPIALDDGKVKKPPNAPPVTQPGTIKINGIDVTIKADGSDGSVVEANTDIKFDKGYIPGYKFDANKIVTELTGPVPTLSATIETLYASNVKPTDPSAYGRGTTPEDQSSGNTTIGFHESCHRQDFQDFIKNNTPPKFEGKVGMTKQQYEEAKQKYPKAVDAYLAKALKYSKDKTDEVGSSTKSQYMAKKKKP